MHRLKLKRKTVRNLNGAQVFDLEAAGVGLHLGLVQLPGTPADEN
jgi:hypothetical protein